MSPTPKPGADSDEPAAADVPPIPDEDGPHDVPDDEVIEETLPTKPLPDRGGGGRPQ